MRRSRNRLEALHDRCATATRLAEQHTTALAEANARMLADPGSRAARQTLETAEQLHYLALYELRHARRALRRREAFEALLAPWTLMPRARRR